MKLKRYCFGLFLFVYSIVCYAEIHCSTTGTVCSIIRDNIQQIADVGEMFYALAYLIGAFCGYKSAIKFKEFNETKGQQVKLVVPMTYLLCCALLVGFPSYQLMLQDSFGVKNRSMQFHDGGGSSTVWQR